MPKTGKTIFKFYHEGHSKHKIAVLQMLLRQCNS